METGWSIQLWYSHSLHTYSWWFWSWLCPVLTWQCWGWWDSSAISDTCEAPMATAPLWRHHITTHQRPWCLLILTPDYNYTLRNYLRELKHSRVSLSGFFPSQNTFGYESSVRYHFKYYCRQQIQHDIHRFDQAAMQLVLQHTADKPKGGHVNIQCT